MKKITLTVTICLLFGLEALASLPSSVSYPRLNPIIRQLEQQFPSAKIEIEASEALQELLSLIREKSDVAIRLSGSTAAGEALVEAGDRIFKIPFSARVEAIAAIDRILSRKEVTKGSVQFIELDLARAPHRNLRGQLLRPEKLGQQTYLARQTLQPGKPILTHAVRIRPSVARGDIVKVNLSSGGLKLSTRGKIQSDAMTGERVKVIAYPTKRPFEGVLDQNHTVEVEL
jgi:flagella basal body P-ring formation protein FlgA